MSNFYLFDYFIWTDEHKTNEILGTQCLNLFHSFSLFDALYVRLGDLSALDADPNKFLGHASLFHLFEDRWNETGMSLFLAFFAHIRQITTTQ